MQDRVTVGMEVQPLLPDRGCDQHEGPERGVEGRPYRVLAQRVFAALAAFITVAHGEARPGAVGIDADGPVPLRSNPVHAGPGRAQSDAVGEVFRKLEDHLIPVYMRSSALPA